MAGGPIEAELEGPLGSCTTAFEEELGSPSGAKTMGGFLLVDSDAPAGADYLG